MPIRVALPSVRKDMDETAVMLASLFTDDDDVFFFLL
jgi:hypothetical protein